MPLELRRGKRYKGTGNEWLCLSTTHRVNTAPGPQVHQPKSPVSPVPSEPLPQELGMPVSRRNKFPGLLLSKCSDPNPLSLVTIIKRCHKRESVVATTRNSLISLVRIFNFFVRTWLCEDMAVEGHLGLTGYSMLQAPSRLSGRREARKSWWLLCSFAHAAEKLSVCQSFRQEKHPFSDLSHQHTFNTAFLG